MEGFKGKVTEKPLQRKRKESGMDRKEKSKANTDNREFAVIAYCFIGLFLCIMGYFAYFEIVKSEDFINNSYNTRQEAFAETVVRGKILSADKEVLAETQTDAEGNETRVYPYGNLFSHIVGYFTQDHGRAGIEAWANFNLLRSNVFFLEKALDRLSGRKSVGDNVVTTLDCSLQRAAYEALGSYNGAIAVMEPATGKILAMVSKPDFNPNTISQDWEWIVTDENTESVLLNRASQGLYPPGSTFKIVTALEFLRENPGSYQNYVYDCVGSMQKEDGRLSCFAGEVHGSVDLERSFVKSCNTSFANIGLSLDAEHFADTCESLLFNSALPVEKLETTKSSFVLNSGSAESEVMETAIGQGRTLVTPLHMLLIASAVANDGVLMKPYVVDFTQTYEGGIVKTYDPSVYGELLSEKEAGILQGYMKAVVEDGTGSRLKGMNYQAYGKTGSAEYGTTKGDSHAWFVGYAHRDGKEDIAVAVIVEEAGVGSTYAVPAAKQIFDLYFGE